jgi:hypothetical protein
MLGRFIYTTSPAERCIDGNVCSNNSYVMNLQQQLRVLEQQIDGVTIKHAVRAKLNNISHEILTDLGI